MDFFSYITNLLHLPRVGVKDVVEIIIIAIFVYEVILWVQRTRAWRLLRGLLVILIVYVLVNLFQLNTLAFILNRTLSVGIIAFVIILQPELRHMLERIGTRGFFTGVFNRGSGSEGDFSVSVVNEIVEACEQMGASRTGALIVIERANSLKEIERTGIELDAVLSSELLENIFEHNTPLHDGAVVVKGDRVTAATCYLPLSENMALPKNLGTRHRAGVGISEVNDCWTVIVSEETGRISLAREGVLTERVSPSMLRDELMKLVQAEERGLMQYLRRQKDER